MSMVGWEGRHQRGRRPRGVHHLALIGAPPEHRGWMVGAPSYEPEIAESALIDAFCTVDAGTEHPTRIHERAWLQKRVHVGHDSIVGEDVELCVGVVLCGHVVVGDGARIGGNSWVKPRVLIGEGAIIGGGSVVTKNVPPHEVWCGNPARYLTNAWTHPDPKPGPDAGVWEAARAAVGFPTAAELDEWHREAAQSSWRLVSTPQDSEPGDRA